MHLCPPVRKGGATCERPLRSDPESSTFECRFLEPTSNLLILNLWEQGQEVCPFYKLPKLFCCTSMFGNHCCKGIILVTLSFELPLSHEKKIHTGKREGRRLQVETGRSSSLEVPPSILISDFSFLMTIDMFQRQKREITPHGREHAFKTYRMSKFQILLHLQSCLRLVAAFLQLIDGQSSIQIPDHDFVEI